MKVNKKELGKVTITCNGKWNKDIEYERLCLIHDGNYASYISKIDVPVGIKLFDEKYWQPIASLNSDIVLNYNIFKQDVIKQIAEMQARLKITRIVVSTLSDRDKLTIKEIVPGCEVYIFNESISYICRSIDIISNEKTWEVFNTSPFDSELALNFNGIFPQCAAYRAYTDEDGFNIKNSYVRKADFTIIVNKLIEDYINNN